MSCFTCYSCGLGFKKYIKALHQYICKLLTFSVFSAFFGAKFSFICKISQSYTDLRFLLDIKVFTGH